MLAFTARRLLISIPLLVIASFLAFLAVAASGDPLGMLKSNPHVPPEVFKLREHQIGLDRPFFSRYWHWATHFVTGDFGVDIFGGQVKPELFAAFGVTLRLVVGAIILALVLAIAVGLVSAVKQYSVTDYSFTFAGFFFLATPVFVVGALLKVLAIQLNQNLGIHIPTLGDSTNGVSYDFWHNLNDRFTHMILPVISLALISFASWSRFQRASLLDVRSSDYIRLARAKGLSPGRVLIRHTLRNALIPLTTVVSIDIAGLLGGAVITEIVFNWRGMGIFTTSAVANLDSNQMLAGLMLTGVIVVLFNLFADLLYGFLDPRIRHA